MKGNKIIDKIWITALIPLMVWGCTNDIGNADEDLPMEVVSFIPSMQGNDRATDLQFETGDMISVYATSDGIWKKTGNQSEDMPYSFLNTKFIANGEGISKPENGNKLYYHAFYPFDFVGKETSIVTNSWIKGGYGNGDVTVQVKTDQRTHTNYTASDFLMATTVEATDASTVHLNFNHKLTKVVVDIQKSGLNADDISITLVHLNSFANVFFESQTVRGSCAYTEGITQDGAKGLIPTYDGKVTMGSDGTNRFKAIVIPTDNLKDGSIIAQLTIGAETHNVKLWGNISFISGCAYTLYLKKTGDNYIVSEDPADVDNRIEDIVPSDIREDMEPWMNIYNGINPPDIQNVYLISPARVVYCSDADNGGYEAGIIMDTDEYCRFSNQDFINNTIDFEGLEVDEYGSIVTATTGEGAFISGSGNNFTVYFKIVGESDGISFRAAYLVSGTKADRGISNCHFAIAMVEKNDPDGDLMEVGAFRIFEDQDGLSEKAIWPITKGRSSKEIESILKKVLFK